MSDECGRFQVHVERIRRYAGILLFGAWSVKEHHPKTDRILSGKRRVLCVCRNEIDARKIARALDWQDETITQIRAERQASA